MSRMPPVPAASQPAYGPGAVPKDYITDLSHHTDLPFLQRHDEHRPDRSTGSPPAGRGGPRGARPGDDPGGMVARTGGRSEPWTLVAFAAVIAAIFWLADRQNARDA